MALRVFQDVGFCRAARAYGTRYATGGVQYRKVGRRVERYPKMADRLRAADLLGRPPARHVSRQG